MPEIKRITGATRNLGAPAGWDPKRDGPCAHLPVRDELIEGIPWMVSAHEFTPDEIALIVAGEATLELWIQGTIHPVVGLRVRGPVDAEG